MSTMLGPMDYSLEIKDIVDIGVEVALVVGGGKGDIRIDEL